MKRGFVIAVVGAESTGKSVLGHALQQRLAADGARVACVDEVLRTFCDREGRTPHRHEQTGIAAEQTRRIAEAAATHDVVVADTTALMIAVYSDLVFDDTSLYAQALRDHAAADLTLLTALDLPWQADGHQRDGPHVRGPVDRKLREALIAGSVAFSVVAGLGPARLDNALRAIAAARQPPPARASGWRHLCARCGDGDCEQQLFCRSAFRRDSRHGTNRA